MRVRVLLCLGLFAAVSVVSPAAQEPRVERTILQRQDLVGVPGYEILFVEATIPVGGREGRHTHPGTLLGYLIAGDFAMEVDGKVTGYKPGESVIINPGVVHEGINRGKVPIKTLATFIVPKGQPLSTMVP